MTVYYYGNTLYHHGVKGQKWGLRRYQNEDGSLTSEGRQHYGYGEARANMRAAKAQYKADQKAYGKAFNRATGAGQYIRGLTKKGREENERRYSELAKTANKASKSEAAYKQAKKEYKNSDEYKARQEKIKKAAKVGLAVAGTALAAYGTYKLSQAIKDKAFQTSFDKGKKYAESILDANTAIGWTGFKDGSYELLNSKHQVIEKGKLNPNSWQRPTAQIAQLQGSNNSAAYKTYSNAMDNVRKDAEEVSKNTLTAAKYLIKNRKRK